MRRVLLVGVPDPPAQAWSAALRERGFGVAAVATAAEAADLPRVVALAGPGVAVDGVSLALPLALPAHELAARVAAVGVPDAFAVGPWWVDSGAGRMTTADGHRESLSPLEAGLLATLAAAGGAPVDREELLTRVWGYREGVVSRAVDHLVSRLRARIEADPDRPRWLTTERGRGYRLAVGAGVELEPVRAPDGVIGRGAEVARALDAWERGARVVTVCGAPGIGASTVARTAAAQLGLALASRPSPLAAALLDDAALAPADLAGAPHRLLIAARAPLGARGEARVLVGPLDAASGAALAEREAARLGVALADPARLAAACDHHPLAIALAVERAPMWAFDELLAAIAADPFAVLRVPFRRPARHASLADTFASDPPPAATRALVAAIAAGAPVDAAAPALSDALARGLVIREGERFVAAPLFARACA